MDNNDRRHGKHHHNYPVLQSMSYEAKDVDCVRYGYEAENSRRLVSNEDVPLLIRDHAGRTTAETRRQPQLNTATQVAVRCRWSTSRVDDCGDAQRNPGDDLFWTKVTSKAGAIDVGEPGLPWRRKTPVRFDDGLVWCKQQRISIVGNTLGPMTPSCSVRCMSENSSVELMFMFMRNRR